jgi:hypothetical protein
MDRLSGVPVLPVLPVLPFSIRHAYTRATAANGGRLLRLQRLHMGRRARLWVGLEVIGEPGDWPLAFG